MLALESRIGVKVAASLAAYFAYALLFIPMLRFLGHGVVALAILPAVLAAWLLGMRAGLVCSLLAFPLNIFLLDLAGETGWIIMSRGSGLLGSGLIVLMGAVVGRLRDMRLEIDHALAERLKIESELLRQNDLIGATNHVFREALFCETEADVARICLSVAEELTNSEFGFIGEVNPSGRFDTIGISDPGWSACRMPGSNASLAIKDMEIRGIWGAVLKSECAQIVNQPASHPDRVGLPEGHPPIHTFLGVPLKYRGQTIGMIGLANKRTGYDTSDLEDVQALTAAFVEALTRKRMEISMRESESQYRSLFDSVPIGLYRTSPDGRTLDVNPALMELLGYYEDREAFLKTSAVELYVDPEDRRRWQAQMEHEGSVIGFEVRFRRRDGNVIWVRDTARAIRDKAGHVLYYEGSLEDITTRKMAENQIRARAELMSRLALLGETLNRALSVDDVVAAIGRGTLALSEADRSAVYIRHPDDTVTCAWSHGLSAAYLEKVTTHVMDVPGGQRLQSSEPVLIGDVQELPENSLLRRLSRHEGHRSVGLWPLAYEDKVIAAVGCYYDNPHTWAQSETEVMQVFARQAAGALKNALLHDAAERRAQRLAALRSIDSAITASMDLRLTLSVLLDHLTSELNVDAADVLLLDPNTQTLEFAACRGFRTAALQHTRLRLGDGYAGRAALERCIVFMQNLREAENSLRRSPLLQEEGFIAYYGIPLIAKGEVKGVLEIFHRSALDPNPEWMSFLESLAGQAAIAIDNASLFESLQRANIELSQAYDTTLEGWAHALELRDKETEGHTRRVTDMTLRLARALGVDKTELAHIRRGAILHDIGKMGIPDSILLKPGALSEDEWELMRLHPVFAYEWLSSISYLRRAMDIPYCHHEKWDGTGYPRGLKGDEIPLAARIFAVVDVWDALNSDRPYRKAWPREKVIEYLREQSGRHFDPKVVEVFLDIMEKDGDLASM